MNPLIGEALVGGGKGVAHMDLAIGSKGGPFETAFISALASPASSHTPLLAVVTPNLMPKPATLMVNKVSIKNAALIVSVFIEWDAKDKKRYTRITMGLRNWPYGERSQKLGLNTKHHYRPLKRLCNRDALRVSSY
jgi:formaldehyde-activating enzyme involved in methanogenesis